MALVDIIGAVNAQIDLVQPGVPHLLGAEFLQAEGDFPRIVWVPTTEDYAAPDMPGPAAGGPANGEPRALATRLAGVDIHLWGADDAACETLIASVVAALRAGGGWWHSLVRGRWVGSDGSELTMRGRAYVLSVQFKVPVLAPATVTQKVPAQEEITAALGASSITYGPF